MKDFKEDALAKFFYEQCAGTSTGHMADIPNNTVLFSLISASTGTRDNLYAASQTDFAEFLRMMASQLDPN